MPRTRPLFLLALLASGGCATVFSSSDQDVSFSSNPRGAEVLVDGRPIGVTPVTARFDRDTFAQHYITLRRRGFQPVQFQLQKTINTVAILNLTSILCWATDALSGALIEYSPGAYHLELRPTAPPPPAGPGGVGLEPAPGADRAALWFVLVNASRIRTDIVRGGGEYVRALAHLWELDRHASRMTIALGREAPVLLARDHPYDLYLEIRRVLRDEQLL